MPDPRELVRWLASPDLVAPDGHCMSWWNPARPGYSYPEATALLLRLLVLTRTSPARRGSLRRALLHDFVTVGAVRRGSCSYTFDTAMALSALLADVAGWPIEDQHDSGDRQHGLLSGRGEAAEDAARGWTSMLIEAAHERNPQAGSPHPGSPMADTHWSLAFGAHQAKACGALLSARCLFGPLPGLDDAVATYAAAALSVQDDDGRVRIHPASGMTYVHSHCYAIEGLLMRDGICSGAISEEVTGAAEWLLRAQQPDGSLRGWHDGRIASGSSRADATAQAVRIWMLVGGDRLAEPAARGCAFLATLWAAPRGLRYEAGSKDLCSWATIFAAQALAWHDEPAAADITRFV